MVDRELFLTIQPGDKLIISSNIDPNERHPCGYVSAMKQQEGKLVTVSRVNSSGYCRLLELPLWWDWTLFDAIVGLDIPDCTESDIADEVILFA